MYTWKESAFFPSVNFNHRYCFSDAAIIFKTFLYDDNFSHSWGDFPPCYSSSRDINAIVLNTHPLTWMRLTQLQQPDCCLFLALVCPFFNFFLAVLKNLEIMVNVKFSNLTGIEAWTSGLIIQSASQ